MAFSVAGKTALVTGGGSGICFAFTNLLLSKGCNVLIVDLKIGAEAALAIEESKGAKVRAAFKQADVTDWKQLEAAFEAAFEEFGRLDIVCPGAGIFEPPASSFFHPQKSTDISGFKTIDLNLDHPIKATQLAFSSFKRQGHKHGAVILISSIAAQMALLPYPIYAATKAGISSFTRSMGPMEQVLGYRVATVAPGIVKTAIWSEEQLSMVDEGEGDEWVSTKKVAETMLDLIQREEYVGGTVLEIGSESTRLVGPTDPLPAGKGVSASAPGAAAAATFKAFEVEFGS